MHYCAVHFAVTILLFLGYFIPSNNLVAPPPRNGIRGWLYTRNPDYVQFFLFSNPENEDSSEEILLGNITSLEKSQFNHSRPLIILIHGMLSHSAILTDVQLVKNAYLSIHHNANIIMVDYRELAGVHFPVLLSWLSGPLSLPANLNVGIVGTRVAAFIAFLKQAGGIKHFKDVHIVGHSLGCHVAGKAGDVIAKKAGQKIGRISGLDCPGGSIFPNLLGKSDASFVDFTHTSFGLGGILGNAGHVEFFINGGGFSHPQPNCHGAVPFTDPYCAHESSVFYFAKSIRNKNIYGCECEWCSVKPEKCRAPVRYGHFVNPKMRGNYYVEIPSKVNYG